MDGVAITPNILPEPKIDSYPYDSNNQSFSKNRFQNLNVIKNHSDYQNQSGAMPEMVIGNQNTQSRSTLSNISPILKNPS